MIAQTQVLDNRSFIRTEEGKCNGRDQQDDAGGDRPRDIVVLVRRLLGRLGLGLLLATLLIGVLAGHGHRLFVGSQDRAGEYASTFAAERVALFVHGQAARALKCSGALDVGSDCDRGPDGRRDTLGKFGHGDRGQVRSW